MLVGSKDKMTDIKTARRCMDFQNIKCDNKDCINKACPLNKIYDRKMLTDKNEKT